MSSRGLFMLKKALGEDSKEVENLRMQVTKNLFSKADHDNNNILDDASSEARSCSLSVINYLQEEDPSRLPVAFSRLSKPAPILKFGSEADPRTGCMRNLNEQSSGDGDGTFSERTKKTVRKLPARQLGLSSGKATLKSRNGHSGTSMRAPRTGVKRNLESAFASGTAASEEVPECSTSRSRVTMEYEGDSFLPSFYINDDSSDGDGCDIDSPGSLQTAAPRDTTVTASPDGAIATPNSTVTAALAREATTETPSSASSSQPPQKRRRVAQRENVRRRMRRPENWEKNRKKAAVNAGQEFTDSAGATTKARTMGPGCEGCNRCDKPGLTQDERLGLFSRFWELPGTEQKWDYISRSVSIEDPKTRSTLPERAKSCTRTYMFKVGERVLRVCKNMFLHTLGISHGRVDTALAKVENRNCVSPDKRGTHSNRTNRVSEDKVQAVKTFIDSIPRVQSHYDRAKTKREYVENGLSMREIYRRFVRHCEEIGQSEVATERQFREVWATCYNIGTDLPKKDLCLLCAKWKSATDEEREEMKHEYDDHIRLFRLVTNLKRKDKKDPEICVSCFDLQKVLTLPRSEIGIMFYEHKLSLYNFTVFHAVKNVGYCFMWDETVARRGSNEMASNLLEYGTMKSEEGFKKLSLYSDACSGQNRNRMVFACHLYLAIRCELEVTHRFLQTGHSFSEADSVHGRIETECTRKEIFSLDEYYDHVRNAKKEGEEYKVITVNREKVFDFHDLVNKLSWTRDVNKKKVAWSKVREVRADHRFPDSLFYRYDFAEELSRIVVNPNHGSFQIRNYVLPTAYQTFLPLKTKKVASLQKLLEKKAIPSKYHPFFQNLIAGGGTDERESDHDFSEDED